MMSSVARYLVVGGDSLVGSATVKAFEDQGIPCLSSTRRHSEMKPGRFFLDFESKDIVEVPQGLEAALVIAAATNYDRCETDPMARAINVEMIPRTVRDLLAQGVHVTFISTNSVFGGERPWPQEDDAHDPRIAYALQKSEGEARILEYATELGAMERLNIVRLTKIMNSGVSPLPSWFENWRLGKPVTPFSDLVFAPISTRFVGHSLSIIAQKRIAGNLHLSGEENVDYVKFAKALAQRLGVGESLIEATTATEKRIHIAFKPQFSGLGMNRTTKLTGIAPQPLRDLIEDIVRDVEV